MSGVYSPRVMAAGKAMAELIRSRTITANGFGGANEYELAKVALKAAEEVDAKMGKPTRM